MNPEQLDGLDKLIGETLAQVPTKEQNEARLAEIEAEQQEIRISWAQYTAQELAFEALREHRHPEVA